MPQRYHHSCKKSEWAARVTAASQPLRKKSCGLPAPSLVYHSLHHFSPIPAISGITYIFSSFPNALKLIFWCMLVLLYIASQYSPKTFLAGTHFISGFLVQIYKKAANRIKTRGITKDSCTQHQGYTLKCPGKYNKHSTLDHSNFH